MKRIFNKLRKAFPFIGARAATEDDLRQYFADAGVELHFTDAVKDALYVMCEGYEFILVNKHLKGRQLLHRLCHEAGHQILHIPSGTNYAVQLFDPHTKDKHEREAEAAAAMLMLTVGDMNDPIFCGVFKYDIHLFNLLTVRRNVFEKTGK